MKQTILALTCVTLLVGVNDARAQAQAYPNSDGDFRSSGDESGFVGDDDDFVGDYGDFTAPIVQTGSFIGDLDSVGDMEFGGSPNILSDAIPSANSIAPQPLGQPMPQAYSTYTSGESCAPATMFAAVAKPAPEKWLRAETLLWFMQERETPPLVREFEAGTPFDDIRISSNSGEFGNPINSGLAPGFRFDYGHYFNDNIGVGARVWGLFGQEEDYPGASRPIVVRPFFDTSFAGGPDYNAVIISGIGGVTGTFNAVSEFNMLATEVYGRLKFGETKDYRIDLLGGYSYFGIDDKLTLSSSHVLAGEQFNYRDSYDAENRFYGGQLGMETTINKGRWSLTSLTKVHLGNMNQRVTIDGASQSLILPNPPLNISNTSEQNGLYVQGQGGVHEEDVFTFVPEMNLRLGYSPREQVHLTVGYTFAYWSSVAMAGEQINPVVDGVNAFTFADVDGAQARNYEVNNGGFWMQGIDLGVTFTF